MEPDPNHRAPALVEHFFRHEYGRTVSYLVRVFGASRIELIEDCVQSSMMFALTSWAQRGLPDNPGAWLTRAAKNAIIDRIRHERMAETVADEVYATNIPTNTTNQMPNEIGDDELRMLFICCDDALKPQVQLVLALKILCGFNVKEIALRLFSNEETIRKRIARGRQQFRSLSSKMENPSESAMKTRLGSVHRVIYLLFNEGYSSAKPDQFIRRELCQEAIRLGDILCKHPVSNRESWALLALMHLHHARIDARSDVHGGILLLEEQNRSLWNKLSIYSGMHCLINSGNTGTPSRFHIEAAILLEHCNAKTYEDTNWPDIISLYEVLEQISPSPLNTLNQSIAVAEWKGPAAGLTLLESLTPPAWLARYYLWDGTLGELYRRDGQIDKARFHLTMAKDNAPTKAERQRIENRLRRCDD